MTAPGRQGRVVLTAAFRVIVLSIRTPFTLGVFLPPMEDAMGWPLEHGAIGLLEPLLTRGHFADGVVGAAYGVVFLVSCIGTGLGACAGGVVEDRSGSYQRLFAGSFAAGAAAVILAFALRPPALARVAARDARGRPPRARLRPSARATAAPTTRPRRPLPLTAVGFSVTKRPHRRAGSVTIFRHLVAMAVTRRPRLQRSPGEDRHAAMPVEPVRHDPDSTSRRTRAWTRQNVSRLSPA